METWTFLYLGGTCVWTKCFGGSLNWVVQCNKGDQESVVLKGKKGSRVDRAQETDHKADKC